MPPAFPLPLRDALAELALAAVDDPQAVDALAWLAHPAGDPGAAASAALRTVHLVDGDPPALLAVHAHHAERISEHAARAVRAMRGLDRVSLGRGTARACRVAAVLWNERLFFEVHEVLEKVWIGASGDERQALQGVIQIAVAFHHLAHGNRRGARTHVAEGRARQAGVAPATLPAIDLDRLLADTAPWETALATADALPAESPPALHPR